MLIKNATLIYKHARWEGISLYYVRDVGHCLETYGFMIVDPDSDTEAKIVADCIRDGVLAHHTAEHIANFRIDTFNNRKRRP